MVRQGMLCMHAINAIACQAAWSMDVPTKDVPTMDVPTKDVPTMDVPTN